MFFKRKPRIRPPPVRRGLAITAAVVLVISWIVEFRDERKHRAEFDLVNHSDISVSATYRGYYQSAEQELAPLAKWHRKFRAGDNLFLAGNFEGQAIKNQVRLWDSVADLFAPGRPAQGEILLWRVSTNAEGKMTRSTPVSSNSVAARAERNVPEFNVNWRLMSP